MTDRSFHTGIPASFSARRLTHFSRRAAFVFWIAISAAAWAGLVGAVVALL
jgi:hypothetical protein